MPRATSSRTPRSRSEHAVAVDFFCGCDEDRGVTNSANNSGGRRGGVVVEEQGGITVSTSSPHRLLRPRSPRERPSGSSSSAAANLRATYREVRRCLIPVLSAAMLVAIYVVRTGDTAFERINKRRLWIHEKSTCLRVFYEYMFGLVMVFFPVSFRHTTPSPLSERTPPPPRERHRPWPLRRVRTRGWTRGNVRRRRIRGK